MKCSVDHSPHPDRQSLFRRADRCRGGLDVASAVGARVARAPATCQGIDGFGELVEVRAAVIGDLGLPDLIAAFAEAEAFGGTVLAVQDQVDVLALAGGGRAHLRRCIADGLSALAPM